ncbi:HNH endonuclease [Leeuwenhoekiella marinoflava]|uniref:5-methylcytosine-specific restriction protein A n=2 Tax=Leeuwenhoekiella marinoflava TaxID=988 RepID=A0A4Q0PN44_9FLAO|nr:HNH endonuclease [Leeuwenhoekiella marinoflava]RXG31863.1 5-methylcytosine-specific restriction protein A [Leeuwenhoekiella marinoflava]SHF02282.1 5-methylcytosine-specific restriction enzyme A [Leeuwenhoekiella marinoflava DSM 3653]
MGKNTRNQIQTAFEIAKKVYLNEVSVSEGANQLEQIGLKRSSSLDYIYAYSKMMQGKLYTRTINAYATNYYLHEIFKQQGAQGLRSALLSLKAHIEYYENTSGASVIKGREIYDMYFNYIKDNLVATVYPDEVELKKEYSEGLTRQVIVNSYERNQLARQECIEHYGFTCQVCDFNFKNAYGELGQDFIHVHHVIDIATIGKKYTVDPKKDLIPVCPNCHAMLHKRKPAYTVSELKNIMRSVN